MSATTTHPARLLDIDNSREYLGHVSREFLYKRIRTGEIAVVKLGRRTFIDRAELDRYIDEEAGR